MSNLLKLIEKHSFMVFAYKEALKSTYKQRLGACLVSSGRIIATGYNQIRYHRIGSKWSSYESSLHAEVACLTSIDKSRIRNATLYILRISNKDDRPMLSYPCPNCIELIKYLDIKKVVYSIEEYPYYKEVKTKELNDDFAE